MITCPSVIFYLAEYLTDYLFLSVGQVGGATTDITQSVVEVDEFEKRGKLMEILKTQGELLLPNHFHCSFNLLPLPATDRTLVFVETKRNADFLASFLSQEGFPTTSIHG